MAEPPRRIIETRYAQMFPIFEMAEIERLRRFGELRTFGSGERLLKTGEVSPGMFVVLNGEVAVTQRDPFGQEEPIVTHGPGSLMGELAQLSGQPSFVDAQASTDVEVLFVPSPKLRDVLVTDAEVGERIMRALILRRAGLIESGVAGPVIVGRVGHGDVLHLVDFLRRNGQPHHVLDPDADSCATTMIQRFHVAAPGAPRRRVPDGRAHRSAANRAAVIFRDRDTRGTRPSARGTVGERAELGRVGRAAGLVIRALTGVLDADEHGALIGGDEHPSDLALFGTDEETPDLLRLGIGTRHLVMPNPAYAPLSITRRSYAQGLTDS